MNNEGTVVELASLATIGIFIMTILSFGITTGMWEEDFWRTDLEGASIVGFDGDWGEDIVVTYTDGITESVKSISNNYWSSLSIENSGSKPISSLQYCINALIPISDTFDTQGYECEVSVMQDTVVFYHITYTYVSHVDVKANDWTRVITVPLDIQSISTGWDDGIYSISFENSGNIEGISVPTGLSLDISIEDGFVSFLV